MEVNKITYSPNFQAKIKVDKSKLDWLTSKAAQEYTTAGVSSTGIASTAVTEAGSIMDIMYHSHNGAITCKFDSAYESCEGNSIRQIIHNLWANGEGVTDSHDDKLSFGTTLTNSGFSASIISLLEKFKSEFVKKNNKKYLS